MPQSILPEKTKIAGTVTVDQDGLSDQMERLIFALNQLELQAEVVTGLDLEEGDA